MSIAKAKQRITANRKLLDKNRSGDPQDELDEEFVGRLLEEIVEAEMHMEDEWDAQRDEKLIKESES